MALCSIHKKAVYQGHDNESIYKNIHNIIRDLVGHGILPKKCYLGRMAFVGIQSMTRVAIRVTPEHIHNNRDAIAMYALEHDYDPDELLRVLVFSSVNAASNGCIQFESITCQKTFNILRALPVSTRFGVLQGRYRSVRLFSAV
jgi:hypothetical protein